MKILHFSYTIKGGAGIAVRKFHELLQRHQMESALINVMDDLPSEKIYQVKALKNTIRQGLNKVKYRAFRLFVRLRYKKSRYHHFTYNYNYRSIRCHELLETAPFKPDVIFLHWVADFVTPSLLQQLADHYQCPILWRYNDLAPATGGCHYTYGCDNYKTGCGKCPALGSSRSDDWSRMMFSKKQRVLSNVSLSIINSTHPTEAVFKSTPLFAGKRQFFIRNSLPASTFYPASDKSVAKSLLGIGKDVKMIFWGATHILEPRKGFLLFTAALRELKAQGLDKIEVIIAGNLPESEKPDIPFPHHFVGLLKEQDLVNHYRAADIVACTSEEDGGPMLIVESLMCGTPVVSFDAGLAPELITTGETGYRAAPGDVKDLAKGMAYILNLRPEEYEEMSRACTRKASGLYGEEIEIEAYRTLFNELKNS